MDQLINLIIYLVIFAVLGWIAYWVCTKFFPEFPPARWICGAVLLIIFLIFISHQLGGVSTGPFFPLHR